MKNKHRLPFNILFEDDCVIVLDKPAGLLTTHTKLHGRAARESQLTVENVLNDYVRKGQLKSKKRVWLVHRLDRETSGVMMFAKTEEVAEWFRADWGNLTEKTYLARVAGVLAEDSGVFESYLLEDADGYKVRSIRVSLGSDRVNLGSDRVGLGSDRVSLGSDRVKRPNTTLVDPKRLDATQAGSTRPNATLAKGPNATLAKGPNATLVDSKRPYLEPNWKPGKYSKQGGRVIPKLARTEWKKLSVESGTTLVEVKLKTGRKNQIRVHFSEAGHPVIGDEKYGGGRASRLYLHALRLGFKHPRTGEWLEFEAPVPGRNAKQRPSNVDSRQPCDATNN